MEGQLKKIYFQYGCGLSAPEEWRNFDVSPTLRIQQIPIIGTLLKSYLNTQFPKNVEYGDIISGLPIEENSCNGIYCSHTLEHLSLVDFRKALLNTYTYLKKDGIFRLVVPDLESAARHYIDANENGDKTASITFLQSTMLGLEERPRGVKPMLSMIWGNSKHLWMWDYSSLEHELNNVGFIDIRKCNYHDSEDKQFRFVENPGRFENSVAIECKK